MKKLIVVAIMLIFVFCGCGRVNEPAAALSMEEAKTLVRQSLPEREHEFYIEYEGLKSIDGHPYYAFRVYTKSSQDLNAGTDSQPLFMQFTYSLPYVDVKTGDLFELSVGGDELVPLSYEHKGTVPGVAGAPVNTTDYTYEYDADMGGIRILEHRYSDTDEEIRVPQKIDGKPIVALGKDAFYQHKKTNAIYLPDGLRRLEGAPFYRCYSIVSLRIPASVAYIESNPVFRCSSLTDIRVDEDNPYFTSDDGVLYNKDMTQLLAYPEGKTDTAYTVPETVTAWVGDCFGYRTRLTTITVHAGVTKFPDHNVFVYPDQITLRVEKGSAAEEYAKTYELNYEYVS